jgi:hypothetical protein
MRICTYDTETYPNFFCCVVKILGLNHCGVYEISARRDDSRSLVEFVQTLDRMVGFNCVGFDYPLVHWLMQAVRSGEAAALGGERLAARLYQYGQEIINSQHGERSRFHVWPSDVLVPQIDLMQIHHLSNRSRATGLKALQVAMRSPSVVDLPYPHGTLLTPEQMDVVVVYCGHDVDETERFLGHSKSEVAFRERLGGAFLSLSDASVGKRTLREALERERPGCTRLSTQRDAIKLADVILPYVAFRREPFTGMLERFRETTVHALQVKQAFRPEPIFHRGFVFGFGLGGLHGSVSKRRVEADAEHEILDVDVTSFYPSLAIVNRLRPAHLGESFCRVYADLFERRMTHPKGSPENGMLKLALNAVFGDSGSEYSKGFYDVAFMLSITVNGQLLLCMLAEALMEITDLEVLQANTDGLTMRFPRRDRPAVDAILHWWQDGTALKLESVDYSRMWIRDVNNYVAERTDGKLKRKGAYEYDLDWWQDPSALCVPRAVEAHMVRGESVRAYLERRLVEDPWDFLIRARVRGKDRLEWSGLPMQKISRYYVSRAGAPLLKIAPALKGKSDVRVTRLVGGMPVQMVNTFDGAPPGDVDLEWYAREAEKLLI